MTKTPVYFDKSCLMLLRLNFHALRLFHRSENHSAIALNNSSLANGCLLRAYIWYFCHDCGLFSFLAGVCSSETRKRTSLVFHTYINISACGRRLHTSIRLRCLKRDFSVSLRMTWWTLDPRSLLQLFTGNMQEMHSLCLRLTSCLSHFLLSGSGLKRTMVCGGIDPLSSSIVERFCIDHLSSLSSSPSLLLSSTRYPLIADIPGWSLPNLISLSSMWLRLDFFLISDLIAHSMWSQSWFISDLCYAAALRTLRSEFMCFYFKHHQRHHHSASATTSAESRGDCTFVRYTWRAGNI